MQPSSDDTAYSLLEWYEAIGVDEAVDNTPRNYSELPTPAETASKPAPKATPRPAPSAPLPANDAAALATKAAKSADTLDALYTAIRAFDGCALKKTALNTVICDGQADARIMVIGEAPGADEDRRGIPFCGVSGQLLDKIFATIGLSRERNLYITNTVFWRPPGNRKPSAEEIAICKPFVERHIILMQPDIMLLVGGVSTQSILGSKTGITRLRGTQHSYQAQNGRIIPCLPLLHPAYLLRQPTQKAHMWQDMLQLKTMLAS